MVQNGVTDAAVVETRLTAANRSTFDADVDFFDPSSRARVILEVSIITIGSDTSLGRGAQARLDGVNAQLRARDEDKRNRSVVRRLLNEAENNTIFTPSPHLRLWRPSQQLLRDFQRETLSSQ